MIIYFHSDYAVLNSNLYFHITECNAYNCNIFCILTCLRITGTAIAARDECLQI